MDEKNAIGRLQEFVKMIVTDNAFGEESYRAWRKKNEETMAQLFDYKRTQNKMPSITALVGVFFHPTEPLVGFNYTQAAHNTLHHFPEGWTNALRLCRGIIFDREGNLVAKPFKKFFNHGEMEETKNLPDESFDATLKHDGHLGIIFKYLGRLFLTTRGSFKSRSAIVGNLMLASYVKKYEWDRKFPDELTLLVEIIHLITKVKLKYNEEKFIAIGSYNILTLEDLDYAKLTQLGEKLGLEVTERWTGGSLENLRRLVKDPSIKGKEGYVVRFKNGLRVKFKFIDYIGRMVQDKLSYGYLMQRIIAGNLEKMIKTLPAEVYIEAEGMLNNLKNPKFLVLSEKKKREYLYGLVPEEKSTSYYRGICRKFIAYLAKNSLA